MKRIALFFLLAATAFARPQQTVSYDSLVEGQQISGFRATAVYLNDTDGPMGARFVHESSGFTLDLLEIQSVPQTMLCVRTVPTSDMGEPHTQEHLLLGKGSQGRAVASAEPMALTTSTAFTMQWRTCYSFYTSAGAEVFYDQFEARLDALLHPDYTDEEIRREVRTFGITENPADNTLGLEEKGTVYNEMVSSTDRPGRRIYSGATRMIYGPEHPLSFNSGGTPEALRVMQPEDIRRFHRDNYHLANMGAVVAVPREMPWTSVLERMDQTLNRVEPENPNRPVRTADDLPAPDFAPSGEIRFVEYPHSNEEQPGAVWLVWPADRDLDATSRTLLELFLETLAGDPTTNLYKRFIDSQKREMDVGAQSVFGSFLEDQGYPVIIRFGDVPVDRMNEQDLNDLRARVLDELDRISSWEAGSAPLQEFNDRLESRVIGLRRNLAKFVNSPPEFGFRGTGADWVTHLHFLHQEDSFRKSMTMRPVLEEIGRILSRRENLWAEYLREWKLTGVSPWVLAATPNPELTAEAQSAREARVREELERLKVQYGVEGDQEALERYRADYDANTAEIEQAASRVAPPRFVDNPPMTLDDQLDYRISQVGGIPLVSSTFDSMTSATTGIVLRADGIEQEQLLYLSLLPELLTGVGVIENGTPVSYEEMSERLRQEILSLEADFSTTAKTGRVELVIRGAGNDATESQRAIEWMRLALFNPDWRGENLPRIRDVVDQALARLGRTVQRAEEAWVQGVATAYWKQDNPLLLSTTSFMTRTHNLHRLRWMLKEGSVEERAGVAQFLNELSETTGIREELEARLGELQAEEGTLLGDAARDLDRTLVEVPDSSLEADWAHLCREMAADLMVGPENALARLDAVRRELLSTGNARLFLIAAAPTEQELMPAIESLIAGLEEGASDPANYDGVQLVKTRLLERDPDAVNPVFVGLLNPNSQSGVFMNTAPLVGYEETDPEKLLDYLSVNLYGGGGAHSIFMKTWGAGLAYSNGIGGRLGDGRVSYYAERTPDLPQTLRFVINELENADYDPSLVEYAIAQAFRATRAASPYENRGEQQAQDFADRLAPETVARFRQSILELRDTPDLASELYSRMNRVYDKVLPGMGVNASEVEDGVFFVIGPEKQFVAWEEYLKSLEGPDVKLYRLYPRDFWMH